MAATIFERATTGRCCTVVPVYPSTCDTNAVFGHSGKEKCDAERVLGTRCVLDTCADVSFLVAFCRAQTQRDTHCREGLAVTSARVLSRQPAFIPTVPCVSSPAPSAHQQLTHNVGINTHRMSQPAHSSELRRGCLAVFLVTSPQTYAPTCSARTHESVGSVCVDVREYESSSFGLSCFQLT